MQAVSMHHFNSASQSLLMEGSWKMIRDLESGSMGESEWGSGLVRLPYSSS